jgi:hypothetical protein
MAWFGGRRTQPCSTVTQRDSAADAADAHRSNSTPTNGLVIIAHVPSSQRDRSMTTLIEVINHGPIRELRLARPPVNALDTDLCRQLIHAVEQAMADDAHGIVLSGSERVFTVHAAPALPRR